jgi:hypothetical protein
MKSTKLNLHIHWSTLDEAPHSKTHTKEWRTASGVITFSDLSPFSFWIFVGPSELLCSLLVLINLFKKILQRVKWNLATFFHVSNCLCCILPTSSLSQYMQKNDPTFVSLLFSTAKACSPHTGCLLWNRSGLMPSISGIGHPCLSNNPDTIGIFCITWPEKWPDNQKT